MSTKKTITKKVAIKNTTLKSKGVAVNKKRKLVVAKGPNCFWVNQGPILKDLAELAEALKTMNEKVFMHHVRKDANDFANWVEHVLKDTETAAVLRKAKKPTTAYKAVVKAVKVYDLT